MRPTITKKGTAFGDSDQGNESLRITPQHAIRKWTDDERLAICFARPKSAGAHYQAAAEAAGLRIAGQQR